jgi:flotillin
MSQAIRIRRIAEATAESIEKVNHAIQAGGESYFRYRQIEMLPEIAPAIAMALGEAKLVTVASSGTSAAESTTNSIVSTIQTVLAAQMVAKGGFLDTEPKNEVKAPTNGTQAAAKEYKSEAELKPFNR